MVVATNINQRRVKPEAVELITMRVLRRERLSPSFARVTVGGGDVGRFEYLGFDQWFRLFMPVAGDSLGRLPGKLDMLSYLRFLMIAKSKRPILRNFTVRAFRADGTEGPELDIDFVLHGTPGDGSTGPAASWAQTCEVGSAVAILDEGYTFNPGPDLRDLRIVADESGLSAVAGILASLPPDAIGEALIEIPSGADRQELVAPPGVDVAYLVRDDHSARPGAAALAAVRERPVPTHPFYGWAVGEQGLASGVRRHWIDAGAPKGNITFCGYWRYGKAAPG